MTTPPAHHAECESCWNDLVLDHSTDHACDCWPCIFSRHEEPCLTSPDDRCTFPHDITGSTDS